MRVSIAVLAALLFASPALADEFDGTSPLTDQQQAQIEADQNEAHKKIDAKYKGDDSPEAKVAKQRDYQNADEQILSKHGVTEKQYLWQTAHETPDEVKSVGDEAKSIEDKRKADAAAKNKPAPAAPQVIRGFDENHPLDVTPGSQKPKLDANGNPIPQVVQLNPADDPNAGLPVPTRRPSRRRSHRRRHRR